MTVLPPLTRMPHLRHVLAPVLAALLVATVIAVGPGSSPAAAQQAGSPPVVVRGGGWGHSVGMSQYGAFAQAKAGRSHGDILRHYYQGVTVGSAGVPGELRVGLLQNQPSILVRSSSRNGSQPSAPVKVNLGNGPIDVAWCGGCAPIDWAIAFEGGRWVLKDTSGAIRGEGGGPVTVNYDFTGGNPTLLRLAQLQPEPDRGKPESTLAAEGNRAATYQWGRLEVSQGAGGLRAVMVLSMQHYLQGLAEMPSSWHPEALRAQAVAGRTYAARRAAAPLNGDCACHLGATPLDQVYAGWAKEGDPSFGGAWVSAVQATDGVAVTSGGALAQTYYSSSHGGRTENSQESWAFSTPFPYLVSVDDPWSLDPAVNNPFARWSATFDNGRFADAVAPDIVTIAGVRPVGARTAGGTPREVEVKGWNANGDKVTTVYKGGAKGIAGAGVKLAFPELRSQQIATLGFPPFADDDGSVHEYNIWALSGRGITEGCAFESFCPGRPVTRDQMATFLAKALGLDITKTGNRFDDLGTTVHKGGIEAIAAAGITSGCGERRYCPADPVTREQMATFLAKAFKLAAGDPGRFTDIGGSLHRDGIGSVAAAGITSGCAADRYCPGDPVTREQMATFLAHAGGYGW